MRDYCEDIHSFVNILIRFICCLMRTISPILIASVKVDFDIGLLLLLLLALVMTRQRIGSGNCVWNGWSIFDPSKAVELYSLMQSMSEDLMQSMSEDRGNQET